MDHLHTPAFLTDVPAGDNAQRCTRAEATVPADVDERGPLVPFRVPPMPKLTLPRHYVTLDHLASHGGGGSHVLPEWERQMILARLQKYAPVDAEAFQQRLSTVRRRNKREHICHVCEKAAESRRTQLREAEESFVRGEKRRTLIVYKRQHLQEIQREEQFVARAKKWCAIVVCHTFLTALMQERRMQGALNTFMFLMAPMVRRYVDVRRMRRVAEELTHRHLNDIPFPHPHVIQTMYGTFFKDWTPSVLEKLVRNAKPSYLPQGSYLMREGDVGRVMYIITLGTVSVILPRKGSDKRRIKENSSGVFQIKAPCYVGEFALVCKEPRSASIYCDTDVGCWAVLPEDYDEVVKSIPADVANMQRAATDVRRRQNLKRFFLLSVSFLRTFPYFEKFSEDSLSRLIDSVEPIVLHDGDFLFREGEMDSSAYFVQDGVAVTRDHEGKDRVISKGTCIGMFECSCSANEPKRASVVSVNYCDIWKLKRGVLIELGMSEPAAFLHCRIAAKTERAMNMPKDRTVSWCFRKDPYMTFCCSAVTLWRMFEAGTPAVFLNGERLALMGQSLDALIIIVSGVVDVTTARSGEQVTTRVRVSAQPLTDTAALQRASAAFRGISRVIGAYEFAACLSEYVCTVTSFGLTEALIITRAQLDSMVSAYHRSLMRNDVTATDAVNRAFKQQNASLLVQEHPYHFIHHHDDFKDF